MGLTISTPAQYAVRTLVHLARRGASDIARVRDVAEKEAIPYPFLAKLVGQLVQAGFLDSFKGPSGGIRLARPPHHVTVLEILECIDGPDTFTRCFLGLPVCSDLEPCPAHHEWKGVKERLLQRLGAASVADLAAVAEARDGKGEEASTGEKK